MEIIFRRAVEAVRPDRLLSDERLASLTGPGPRRGGRWIACAAGKASIAFARRLEEGLSGAGLSGLAVVPHGYAAGQVLRRFRVLEAGHPVPDAAGLSASEEVRCLVDAAGTDDVVVVAVSGGASALLPALAPGISLEDASSLTGLLLRSGAPIGDVNVVRAALSTFAEGRLAARSRPARCVGLVLSDVPGDDLSVVGSGPTLAPARPRPGARSVLERLGLWDAAPASVRAVLEAGGVPAARGRPAETHCVGSNRDAVAAAAMAARSMGYEVTVSGEPLVGEAKSAGRIVAHAALAIDSGARRCLVWGGETTVTVRGAGVGGRNQELALAAACELDGRQKPVTILAAGTDGRDGPTPAAGAVVDGNTCIRARALGIDPHGSLDANDSFGFFERVGGLVVTGPTHTNVMDLTVAVVG